MKMEFKSLWTTVLLLSVFALEFSNARNWNSLSFGPDFEKQWAFDENKVGAGDFNERPIKPSGRLPLTDEKSAGTGKMNRKNCFMSPVQCSFYFKRSVRSSQYI